MRAVSVCARAALIACASLSGCASTGLRDSDVRLAIEGEDVLASMDDLDVAQSATAARLERLEELVRLAPTDTSVRRLLIAGWARYGLLFAEDDVDDARARGDSAASAYHAARAQNAYDRALHHARAIVPGLEAAAISHRVAAFVADRRDDPRVLLWAGAAYLGRARIARDGGAGALAGETGEALLERSAALAPNLEGGWAYAWLGWWRGRPDAPDTSTARAKTDFARATASSGQRALLQRIYFARSLVCRDHDASLWEATLRGVLDAADPAPEFRLENAVAKRKAGRDITGARRAQCMP